MKITQPSLPNKSALDVIGAQHLLGEATLESALLMDIDASGLEARNMNIDEALLEKVVLQQAKLEKLRLSDTVLRGCDLSAAACSESSLIRVQCIGGRMTGIDLSLCILKDVMFEDCKLDMANLRRAKLTRVRFKNCLLQETDFQQAELRDVTFESCELIKMECNQCTLAHVDARTSHLFDIRGWQSLKGLTIDSTQLASIAPELANELGLDVVD